MCIGLIFKSQGAFDFNSTYMHIIIMLCRYAAVRKQFGPAGSKEEISLIEYPLHVSYCYVVFAIILLLFL